MESTSTSAPVFSGDTKKKKGFSAGSVIALAVLVVLVVLWALGRYTSVNIPGVPKSGEGAQVAIELQDLGAEEGKWQAVFLTNGQVYFGHLKDADRQYGTLEEVYYLQVQQPLQETAATTTGQMAGVGQQAGQQQLVLIKFGTELHGPEDKMVINRDHILFWEDLKSDSTVVRSIVQYRDGQQQPQ